MAYSDSIRQQYATFTTTADLIDNLLTQNFSASFDVAVVKGTSAASNVIEGYLFSNSTDPFQLNLNKSRGASLNVNTIVANGDVLGRINFRGANGTSFNTACRIEGIVDGTPGATNDMPGAIVFSCCADGTASATERMRIGANGAVGIGRTSPGVYGTLEVGGSNDPTFAIVSTNANATALTITAIGNDSIRFNSNFNFPMTFFTNNTERMRLTETGRLVLGNTSPSGTLDVRNVESNSIPTGRFISTIASDVSQTALVVGKKDNNSTSSQIFVQFAINGATTLCGQINANGANTAAFGSTSDERLKENITDLPPQLNNILSLRPVEFDYKDGSGHQIGFIAQEVYPIYPDLVGTREDGMYTLTDLNKNDSRLIKAFQELAQQVTDLAARVESLENAS